MVAKISHVITNIFQREHIISAVNVPIGYEKTVS